MRILLATSNQGKVRELRAILEPLGFQIDDLSSFPSPLPEPVEDGTTFEANARIKARGYALATQRPCLAEDSGLEVDALEGAPGVHSARFAGGLGHRGERDAANNERLLCELKGVAAEQRTARFVCAMCVATPAGEIVAESRGTFEGQITESLRGSGGFGYDPLFWLPDLEKTSAELSSEEKNERSHRGAAARALASELVRRRG